jgi:ribonuclease Z
LFIADMQLYLERTQARLPFDLHWIPLEAGASFDLGSTSGSDKKAKARGGRRVVTFPTKHIQGRLTLGYKIVETRRRLKAEYSSLTQEEIRDRARANGPAGARDLSEDYEATLVAFGGDGLPLEPDMVQGSELLLHEATILDPAERKHQLHSTLDEAVRVAARVRPKALVLYHISGRYRAADITDAACQSATRHEIDFPIWCLFRDRLWNVVKTDKGQRYEQEN